MLLSSCFAGSEITRKHPIGHLNAVFIEDSNTLVRFGEPEDPADTMANLDRAHLWPAQEAIDNAAAQGAFVFWNHPWAKWLRGPMKSSPTKCYALGRRLRPS